VWAGEILETHVNGGSESARSTLPHSNLTPQQSGEPSDATGAAKIRAFFEVDDHPSAAG